MPFARGEHQQSVFRIVYTKKGYYVERQNQFDGTWKLEGRERAKTLVDSKVKLGIAKWDTPIHKENE